MLTTRDAARLLSAVHDARAVDAITTALGFGPSLAVDRPTARRLGLSATEREPRLAPGRGTLRALIVECVAEGDSAPSIATIATIARGLTRVAPECLWLLVAHDAARQLVFLAAPPPGGVGPVAALAVHTARVRESDAETLAALVGAQEGPDLLVHSRWCETLGRDALSRRFYAELEGRVAALAESAEGRVPVEARRTIALLHTSRLIFLAFLEARGWLDGDREFLRRHFTERAGGRGAHRRFLEPLWFGTLNTPWRARAAAARAFGRVPFLNGGLFTRTPLERRWTALTFTDDAIGEVIGGLLARYRLTARESSAEWSDAAVDPEMLGRAFECLMHSGVRRAQGAFYTPPALITRLGRDGIAAVLAPRGFSASALDAVAAGEMLSPRMQERFRRALDDLRVLDPACGSGAFLVFALEEVSALRKAGGDTRDASTRHRDVLTRNIFGVDVNPTAVWLCQLRLWLAVMVHEPDDDPTRLAPLPNLDRNVREGDALAGLGFDDATTARGFDSAVARHNSIRARVASDPQLAARRVRYARASGARKRSLGLALEREERLRVIALHEHRLRALTAQRRDLLSAARSPDLFARTRGADARTRDHLHALRLAVRRTRAAVQALRLGAALPFSFATHFPDAAARNGFSLVLGNPPWVRTHGIPAEHRATLKERFEVFRNASWESGAAAAAAGRGFSSQVDLAALFTERAVRLTHPEGAIALLLPAKLWGSLAGGGLRAFLADEAPPLVLEDWGGSSAGFDAVVYPSALVARRKRSIGRRPSTSGPTADCAENSHRLTDDLSEYAIRTTVHRVDRPLTWLTDRARLPLDDTPGAPWLLLPPEVRAAFDAMCAVGTPLAESAFGRPLLGVKSGCNEAFVVTRAEATAERIESECLRPLLRGEHLTAWRPTDDAADAAIIWTHDARGEPCASLPAGTLRRLTRWRRTLEQRSDGRGGRWWSLFRTESARADKPRVVWGDIGRAPRALMLHAGDPSVPLNTCYVVRARTDADAFALTAVLNSSLGAAWLGALAEPARGGYFRFLGWTCARFPLPTAWDEARKILAPIGRRAAAGAPPDAWTLTEAVLQAYRLRHADVAPLLSWHAL